MEQKTFYKVVGLMSGTSGDGLDIAYCEFEKNDTWAFSIRTAETAPFPKKLGKKLKKAHTLNGLKLTKLDVDFGRWMGEQVKEFVSRHGLEPEAVASHGHTVFHQPQNGISLQIGNGWSLRQACGLTVINDFRMLDVQLGGQGAPLVPIGDQLLFGAYDYCINLGGIANISMDRAGKRLAFDVCFFNLLLNHFAEACGKPYDKDGKLAAKGKLLKRVLKQLNKLPYYHIEGAKSLGREDLDAYLKILEWSEAHKPANILHTLVVHFAQQLQRVLEPMEGRQTSVLITGGGAKNLFFIEKLKETIGPEFVIVPAGDMLVDFKEALVFAFLGVLRLRGEINTLASVTGASRDNCGGVIFNEA
ncbi:anhydro-N-acetylmuramic acid kinase [Mariniradius sediminis]|uniref:Anhydro-N-acetylmuramic acid kinase n=1 Tax=Mariniradius sediminis TaxID=2909237 RepID=A0ABS9BQS1_9BACT|nr:anhydro-N-acetylmuramic acid kinase [Mariniradius sediminis]MCF1750362.1 anhydro-N-acetylmuramic acid kinase [Mariniradius sediminis]